MDGKYSIKLNPGTYNLKFSFIGYKDFIVNNIQVEADKVTTVNAVLSEDVMEMDVIEIKIAPKTNTATAVIEEIKNSEQVVSGTSQEQISKSQDRDAAQAMQRIPGVTILESRFIMVRGLSERYNSVMINDAISPSTEIDRRTFAFDLIPSNMLDRMLVFKSGSAELPGDFAGGVIKIYTRSVPDFNSFGANFTLGYRSNATFQSFYNTKGSSIDFLGFGSSYRNLPEEFPENIQDMSIAQSTAATKLLNNNWTLEESKARPDIRFNLGFSKKWYLKKVELGTMTGMNYSNTFEYRKALRRNYDSYNEETKRSPIKTDYVDEEFSNNVRLGLMNNWVLKINPRHSLELKNMFNQLGEEETIIRNGTNNAQSTTEEWRNYSFGYSSRSIYSGQLVGKHTLSPRTTFNWVTGLSYLNSKTPDLRRARTSKTIGVDEPYTVYIPPTAATFDASRFYSNLNESTIMNRSDFDHKFFSEEDSTGVSIKFGYYAEYKSRKFAARWMSYKNSGSSSGEIIDSLRRLPLGQVFAPENINANNGFYLSEGTNPSDTYNAQNLLTAGYASVQIPIRKFNLSTGARVEHNVQSLQSETYEKVIEVKTPITSVLPFFNLSYNLSKKMLLRGAYSKTVNRPEFREIAPFLFHDFRTSTDQIGNPKLGIATIHNYDLRYELYPSASETFSIGGFYKKFINPIETYIVRGTDNISLTFNNAPQSTSYGLEIEMRKSLYTLSQLKFIQNLSIVFNGSIIKSEVDLGKAVLGSEQKRSLQGQSPYVVNAAIYYTDEDRGLTVNLLYNVFGKRIFLVGDDQSPTIYEMPRHVLDLTVIKTLSKHFEARVGVTDLLNYQSKLIQDSNSDSKITNADEFFTLFRRGSYYTAGISYKF
jgi:TonB-dependent receptor